MLLGDPFEAYPDSTTYYAFQRRATLASAGMEPDDQPDAVYLTVGVVRQPAALLALAVGIITAVAWLVMTSGDLATPAAWVNGK
jgi:hypothetical protein